MERKADFITYPGTGMWMTFGRYMNVPDNYGDFTLIQNLTKEQIQTYVNEHTIMLYWIDQGTGAATLMRIRHGNKSSSATLVTPAILKRYLKE